MEKQKEDTEEQKERKKLWYYTSQYRIAIRWLRDAKLYKQNHASDLTYDGKPWKENKEAEIGADSVRAYSEAVASVLAWRSRINKCNDRLIDLVGENNGKE